MKRQLLTSIVILILMVSCKKAETKKTEIIEEKTTTEIKIEENIGEEQFVENDSLAFAFQSELEKFTFKNPMFKSASKPYQNHHDKTVIDTIKTLTYDKTELEFYKAANWEHIIGGIIKNPEIEFFDSIKIGIKKETLENILKTQIATDLVTLGNLEQTSLFTFQFENGILKSIKFQGYFD